MPALTDAWARQLTVWEEIPGPFQAFVPDDPLPFLIYSPPDTWGNCKVEARLTLLSKRGISVLKNAADGVRISAWLFAELDYVEVGAVHLYSWLRLSGMTADRPSTVQVAYNAVVAPLFMQVVQAVRQTWAGAGNQELEAEQVKLAGLDGVDYKFENYVKESILPGERVLAMVYQPEITIPRFLGARRRLTVAYVCVLTDRELILVSDDDSSRDMGRYGVVRRFIPLTKIKAWQLEAAAWNKLGVWRLQLPGEWLAMNFSFAAQASLVVLAALLDEAREKERSLSR